MTTTVADLLKTKTLGAITVPSDATVGAAIETMYLHRVGAVIVAEVGDETHPVGIFTERDILRLYAEGHHDFATQTIGEHMTKQLVVGAPSNRLDDVLALMTERRFRHMPVLDNGQLIGVISIGDLVKAKLARATADADALRDYIHT